LTLEPVGGAHVRVVLLDIEGTTTPITFVTDVLFPYARERVLDFLRRRGEEAAVREDRRRLREEHAADARAGASPPPGTGDVASEVAYVHWLMDRDRKSTGLKALQGRIWEEGYARGDLRGDVYADVPPAFERWRRQGRAIAIFSSGSVLAQRLLFRHTPLGDLTPFLAAHFDTTTGGKREADSYRRIATLLSHAPHEVLFVSDVAAELDAARAAGMGTALCWREPAPAPPSEHPVVMTFAVVCP
jgi:enolase-phosphatase E1